MKPDSHNTLTCRVALGSLLVLLLPIFSPNLFTPLGRALPSVFSEWNAPKPRHLRLLLGALNRQTSDQQQSELWSPLANQGWKPCVQSTNMPQLPKKSQGYIQVFLDGGLNQQRMGICDAVAVAKILNATLVIPHLEVNPVWQDSRKRGLKLIVWMLPVKTLDGKLYYRTVPKMSQKFEYATNGEDIGDNEADGEHKSFFKLMKAEMRAKIKRMRKEEKQQGKEGAKVEEVQQAPQAKVLEDYAIGDEVGKLKCEHGYHVECIHQWLRPKNWCPICKGSAATSPLPSIQLIGRTILFL